MTEMRKLEKMDLTREMLHFRFHGQDLPVYMFRAAADYIIDHEPTGGFLKAVIEDRLSKAVGAADLQNLKALAAWSAFFYNHAPQECWGSPAAYARWIKMGKED